MAGSDELIDLTKVQRQVAVTWPALAGPALAVNQFLLQLGAGVNGLPEEIILIAGHVGPPIVTGTPDEQDAKLTELGSVQVVPVAHLVMTQARARELLGVLSTALRSWDELAEQAGDAE